MVRVLPLFNDSSLQGHKETVQFVDFIKWGVLFCDYATKVLNATKEQKSIDEIQKKKEVITTKITLITEIEKSYKDEGML